MNQSYEPLEAALLHEYGIDLREALWGREPVGARRLISLVRGLPPDSALHRATDPRGWNWNNKEELLAGILERVDWANILYLSAHGVKEHDLPPAVKVTRPWAGAATRPPPPRMATSQEMAAAFGGAVVVEKRRGKGDEVSS